MRVRLPYGLLDMAKWWNWYTRDAQNVVPLAGMGVRLSPWLLDADAAGAQLAFIRPVSPARYRDLQLAGGPVLIRAS